MENTGAHIGLFIIVPVLAFILLWALQHVVNHVIPSIWAEFKEWLGIDGRPWF